MSERSPNPSYLGVRRDMLELVPAGIRLKRVLDVGCAAGATSRVLAEDHPGVELSGIEVDPDSAEQARAHLAQVWVGDAGEQLTNLATAGEQFDLVLCGDVLEHLVDPWGALATIRSLCPSGYVIVSLPNIAHASTLASLLLHSYWPYRERGIHDRTHLRFFGRRNLPELFDSAGFVEVERRTHHRIIERPHPLNERFEPFISRLPLLRRLTEYQFVSLLRPTER